MTRSLPTRPPGFASAVLAALRAADAGAAVAGVRIRELETIDDHETVSRLLSRIWNRDAASPQLTADLLRALRKTGNYVAGAYVGPSLVGAAVGFFASPATTLHSHIAGVAGTRQARNVGYALKLHQRVWALQHGASTITWTFDPLVRRNGYFNIAKLAARAVEYLPNFYGRMHDPVTGGDESDRIMVHWTLLDDAVIARCEGAPSGPVPREPLPISLAVADDGSPQWDEPGTRRFMIAVPADIEQVRVTHPDLARSWRVAVREALVGVFDGGGAITGFDQSIGYIVETGG